MDEKQARRIEKILARVNAVLGVTYEDVSFLDEGGMSAVFTGRHKRLKRIDAIKVLFVEGLSGEDALDRFRGEWETIAALGRSPHIISIYEADHDEESDLAWLTEEFIDGPSLKRKLEAGRMPLRDSLEIAVQIARGLEYAHERGIIHRDIKPGNILIDKSGETFITDFGLARFQGDERLTQTHMAVGTLAFMSPEALAGEDPAPPMDIYSLGVVLFELFTGERLFTGADVIQKQISERPPDPRSLAPDLPEGLGRLILGMLEKKAVDRPDTATVRRALEDMLTTPAAVAPSGAGVDATLPEGTRVAAEARDRPASARKPRWPWIAAAAAILVVLGIAWTQLVLPGMQGDDAPAETVTGDGAPGPAGGANGEIQEPGGPDGSGDLADGVPASIDTAATDTSATPEDSRPEGGGSSTAGAGSPAGDAQNDAAPPVPLPTQVTLQVGVTGAYRRQAQSFRILVDEVEIGNGPGRYSLRRPASGKLVVELRQGGFTFTPTRKTLVLGSRDLVKVEFLAEPN